MKTLIHLTLILAISVGAAFADENFEKYDANRDKSVTYVELAQAKKREFDAMDRNRDNAVSSEEFKGAMEAQSSEKDSEESGKTAQFNLFETPDFAKLDGDKNSQVSLAEFGASIKAIINNLDTTADNAVSVDEYMSAVTSAQQKAAAASSAAGPKGSAPKGSAPKGTPPKKPSDT